MNTNANQEIMENENENLSNFEAHIKQALETMLADYKTKVNQFKVTSNTENIGNLYFEKSNTTNLINEFYESYKTILDKCLCDALEELNKACNENEVPTASTSSTFDQVSEKTLKNANKESKNGDKNVKPRGRMTSYAFFVQHSREEQKREFPGENVVFSDFSKDCANKWKMLTAEQKKPFQEMADRDKQRYESELQTWAPPPKKNKSKKVWLRKGQAPKRPLSAFFWFCDEHRSQIKELYPEYDVADVAQELARRWKIIDTSVKAKYEAMADRDQARYEKELDMYKSAGAI